MNNKDEKIDIVLDIGGRKVIKSMSEEGVARIIDAGRKLLAEKATTGGPLTRGDAMMITELQRLGLPEGNPGDFSKAKR